MGIFKKKDSSVVTEETKNAIKEIVEEAITPQRKVKVDYDKIVETTNKISQKVRDSELSILGFPKRGVSFITFRGGKTFEKNKTVIMEIVLDSNHKKTSSIVIKDIKKTPAKLFCGFLSLAMSELGFKIVDHKLPLMGIPGDFGKKDKTLSREIDKMRSKVKKY